MDWLPGLDFSVFGHWLAQASPPAPDQVELLKSQIEFLKDANAALADNFARYVDTVNASLTVAGFVLSAITLLGGVLFGKSLWEFRRTLQGVNQEVERRVRQRVEQEVAVVVQNRIDKLEAVLAREAILGNVSLSYIIPTDATGIDAAKLAFALKVLNTRGFQTFPKYLPALQNPSQAAELPKFTSDIVVLDLVNTGLPVDQYETVIEGAIAKTPKQQASLIIYLSGRSNAIATATNQGHYCSAANSPLTLVARVTEAAYVADAIKR